MEKEGGGLRTKVANGYAKAGANQAGRAPETCSEPAPPVDYPIGKR